MAEDRNLRKRILRKSLVLFFSRGFSRVTTQDIAASLGISKKTLYNYFSSKHEIVLEAIEANLEGLGARIEAVRRAPDMGFSERFSHMLVLIHKQVSSISQIFIEDMSRHLPDVWEKIDAFRRNYILLCLQELLHEGQQEGVVREEIDLEAVLFIMFGTINSAITPEQLSKTDYPLSKILVTLLDVFYKGLLTPQGVEELDENSEFKPKQELGNEEKLFIE